MVDEWDGGRGWEGGIAGWVVREEGVRGGGRVGGKYEGWRGKNGEGGRSERWSEGWEGGVRSGGRGGEGGRSERWRERWWR